jgi:squalene-associated FAD-dependent desaturase
VSSKQPIVIGAGVAGLAAAVELARAGLRPRLLEARPFVGGRVRSFVHAATGDEIDNGQHLLMGCYHQTFRLLELIGTRDLVSIQDRLRVDFRDADGSPDRLIAARSLPSPLDVLWGMLRLRRLSVRERLSLVRVARAAMRHDGPDETVESLLTRLGQSRAARERLWDPIVIATLNTAPHQASALLFLEVMRRAFLGRGDDSRLAIPRVGLSGLLEPAVSYINDRGGSVELGASVVAIVSSGGRHVIRVKDHPDITTTRLVLAVPPRSAATLLEAQGGTTRATTAADDPLELSPIVSLYLWYDRPLDDLPEITALLGTRVQWVFNRRRMMAQPARDDESRSHAEDSRPSESRASESHAFESRTGATRLGLLSCTISAADAESAESAEQVIARADAELRGAFAELASARLVDALVVTEKHATFRATPSIGPLRPATHSGVAGLYLAGDWTATGLPATIEGAAQSGFDAAAALLADDSATAGHSGRPSPK